MAHSFAVDNLRQYVEFTDNKVNQLAQHMHALFLEVTKLKKTVNKLKNGEEVDDEAENTQSTDTNASAPQMMPPQMAPQMPPQQAPNGFNQMPQLQTLNLNTNGP